MPLISREWPEQRKKYKNWNKVTQFLAENEEFMTDLSMILISLTMQLGGYMTLKKCYKNFGPMDLQLQPNCSYNLGGLFMLLEWVFLRWIILNQQIWSFRLKIITFPNFCSMSIETQLPTSLTKKATTTLINPVLLKREEKCLDYLLSNFGKVKNTFSLDWIAVPMLNIWSFKNGLFKQFKQENQRKAMISSSIRSLDLFWLTTKKRIPKTTNLWNRCYFQLVHSIMLFPRKEKR